MGQYYKPLLIAEDGAVSTLHAHQYGNGLKLMEHSYIGNDFVNAVLTQINERSMRVAWMGDYADECYGDPFERKLPHGELMKYYFAAWDEKREDHTIHPESKPIITLQSGGYLVNHTQRRYIDMKEYIAENKWTERRWNDPSDEWDMCIHPLPLLTACGNGRGNGDYCDCFPNYGEVGTWAFDLIEYTQHCPEGYDAYNVRFTEQEEVAA